MKYAQNTQVSIDRSRAEIERILMRYGASKFGYIRHEGHIMIDFRASNRNIRFIVNVPRVRKQNQALQTWEQAIKQQWRALSLVIKAKLEAVESGIATFETEFMPYMVLPSGKTVAEEALPAIAEAYKTGKPIPLLNYGG